MNKKQFIADYHQYLTDNSNPERAVKEKAYLYSDLDHYGLSSSLQKQFVKQNRDYLKDLSKPEMLELAIQLWNSPSHEEKSMALSIINLQKDQLDSSDMDLIEKIMRESRGWALLDGSIIPFMPVILEKDEGVYEYLTKWIEEDDYWVRRSALLAQLLFFRYDNGGDRELFFDLARSQFNEDWIDDVYPETLDRKRARFFIRKAIGWTLREMSQKQPKVVYDFLNDNKDEMSGLSFREGSRKLPEEYLSRF